MICVSLAEPTLAACLAAIQGLELAEIRIDKTELSVAEVRRLFAEPGRLIATCRPGSRSEEEREAVLIAAINAGAAYVDLEVGSSVSSWREILAAARPKGCQVIASYHNPTETPPGPLLLQVIDDCFGRGGDIAKVVCRVRTSQECARILSLYESKRDIIALGLGDLGLVTRIAAPFLGAPLTYACLAPGKETAEGQPDIKSLEAVMSFLNYG